MAVAELPSEHGNFMILGFANNKDYKDHIAVVKGDVYGKEDVLTRLHSACLTGDALGSRRVIVGLSFILLCGSLSVREWGFFCICSKKAEASVW